MSDFVDELKELSSAEDFFKFLEVEYDPTVVNVNRLHILKKYQGYLSRLEIPEDNDEALRDAHRAALARAHLDFTTSDARTEKLFKVFQEAGGKGFVSLDTIAPLESTPRSAPL